MNLTVSKVELLFIRDDFLYVSFVPSVACQLACGCIHGKRKRVTYADDYSMYNLMQLVLLPVTG